MKKTILTAIGTTIALASLAQDIALPSVDKNMKSANMIETLATRHSSREFAPTKLTNQELSNLCWAACGVSRDKQHRTSPTARNLKEIRLFVFTADGAYEYMPNDNKLKMVKAGDNRKLISGGQNFAAEAPVSLVMVIDFDIFGGKNEKSLMMGCVDAGNVSENINLYCQAVGLCTVPRATMDIAGISTLLGLSDKQLPIMNNPVGHPKK